ncbi:hypothetical protein VF21_04525 [Pseudogymnoascus sp. 05NY08]|nr:hypothetical protein VF21_04525 [Pseudogymnoascus sp. 05NY08]
MFRLNMLHQPLWTRPCMSETILNSGLRRAVHVSASLQSRYPRSSSSSRSRRKSTIESATIFTKPGSHGKSIIMSKWSQSKDSNNAFTNTATNPGMEIVSLNTSAHVGFQIISAESFAREFKRRRHGSSINCRKTLHETVREIRETIEEIRRSHDEFMASKEELKRSLQDFIATLEESRRTREKALNECFAEIERHLEEHFNQLDQLDRLYRLLIAIAVAISLVHLYSELEERGHTIKDGKVQKLQ